MNFKVYIVRSKEEEKRIPEEMILRGQGDPTGYPCIFVPLHAFLIKKDYGEKERYEKFDYEVVEASEVEDFYAEVG